MRDANNSNNALRNFYDELVIRYDADTRAMWCSADPKPRPCFTPGLIRDLNGFLNVLRHRLAEEARNGGPLSVDFLVLQSYQPGVFSLGGDLRLFVDLIRAGDTEALRSYVHDSIRVLHSVMSNVHAPITSVALVQGNALGAGFEGALACDTIIAEETAQLGFPEVLFNMFPGMGAYSFLARRIAPAQVEKMILSGRLYSAGELHELGVIDVVVPPGELGAAFDTFRKRFQKSRNTYQSLLRVRDRVHPVSFEELIEIGDIWVDAAFRLSERELRTMERLIKSQDRQRGETAGQRREAARGSE
ncbi:MAG TPA: crotonase/enoyl-CoA hydratase family protein [Gammaproteobacteria bacterium]|nr:crotonase/enoyl-CoA hydratase family protein [Gammaproteobacteria bacterium]